MKGIPNYNDYKATTFTGKYPELPKGGYILKIMNVKEEEYSWGSVIALQVDIAEGEHKGHYLNRYNHDKQNTNFEAKFKGSYRITIPVDDGDKEKFSKRIGFFKSQMDAIAESNNAKFDLSNDFDVSTLKGKLVGGLFNSKEWEYNGNTGWYTQCARLCNVSDIRENKFTLPKDQPLKNKTTQASTGIPGFEETTIADGEVPF